MHKSSSLHVLQSPLVDGWKYQACQWMLETLENAPIEAPPNFTMREGDMLFFPELNTGAGELGGVRIVGPRDANGDFPLLSAGIEKPIFPTAIAVNNSPAELRERYEQPLEQVLKQQGFSMEDLYGGPDDLEEFWRSPDSEPTEVKEKLIIPLSKCKWLGLER